MQRVKALSIIYKSFTTVAIKYKIVSWIKIFLIDLGFFLARLVRCDGEGLRVMVDLKNSSRAWLQTL